MSKTKEKSTEELIKELLTSKDMNSLTAEKIKHIKNITKEVVELDKLNFEGSSLSYLVILLLFMGYGDFKVNKEENKSKI